MPELFLFFLIKKLACVDCNSDMTQNREEKEVKRGAELLYYCTVFINCSASNHTHGDPEATALILYQ